jgi:hypothetical protein
MTTPAVTTEPQTTTRPAGGSAEPEAASVLPIDEILRDIARGGLAGLIVGIVVAGLGGRIVMRLAALIVPSATGAFTENGNRIGDITLAGSLVLIVFVGLLAAVFFGVIWVVISPWLPGRGWVKGVVAMPIAVAFGAVGLIEGGNVDFFVLRRDPLVVAVLVALVALTAPAMALADGWLDRHLPHAPSGRSTAGGIYVALTVIGGTLGAMLMLQALVGPKSQPLGFTVVVVGLMTLAWWYQRVHGRTTPPRGLVIAARTVLVLGTVAGFAVLIPEIRGALGTT